MMRSGGTDTIHPVALGMQTFGFREFGRVLRRGQALFVQRCPARCGLPARLSYACKKMRLCLYWINQVAKDGSPFRPPAAKGNSGL